MSDRFSVSLSIGGECSQEVSDQLIEILEDNGPDSDPEVNEDHLEAQFNDVPNGNIAGVHEFCKANDLSWEMTVEGSIGYGTVIEWWHPGMDNPDSCLASTSGEPVMVIDRIQEWLDCSALRSLEKIESLLKDMSPPELPKFTVLTAVG